MKLHNGLTRTLQLAAVAWVGPLTLKFDRATRHYHKNDRRHCTLLKSTVNRDKGHCQFLISTGDIGTFLNRQGNLKNSDRRHWGYLDFLKSIGDIGGPPSRAPWVRVASPGVLQRVKECPVVDPLA